jgi:ABC-type branched-subunit amino acid transport system ATPase component
VTQPALQVEGLNVRYGGVTAVKSVSLSVNSGAILTLLGPNGAGKTSLLHGISGLTTAAGTVTLNGQRINSMRAARRARAGLGHVLEGRHIFPDLTVAENLRLGGLLSPTPQTAVENVLDLLPELRPLMPTKAGRLSGGQQQLLAIARALSGTPRVLLLDEPTNGLAPILIERTTQLLQAVCDLGVAVLLVEQRLKIPQVLRSDALILRRGEVIGSSNGAETDFESRVHAAYFT